MELEKKIIKYFLNNENNGIKKIALKFNVKEGRVNKIINNYFKTKTK